MTEKDIESGLFVDSKHIETNNEFINISKTMNI
jgi:hypothetical protein